MVKTAFFSLGNVHRIVPDPDTALLLITGDGLAAGNGPMQDGPQGFASVLQLCFDDADEESLGLAVGSVPDRKPDGGPLCVLQNGETRILPDIDHARAILDFVDQAQCSHLLIHSNGIRRTAAVIKFLVERRGVLFRMKVERDTLTIPQRQSKWLMHNDRLLRMLNLAHEEALSKEALTKELAVSNNTTKISGIKP
jgi:predicted protein tyrosine phosphatase